MPTLLPFACFHAKARIWLEILNSSLHFSSVRTCSPSSPSYFPRSISPSNLTPLRSTASSTEPTPQAASSHSTLPSQTTLLLPAHSPGLFLSPLSSPSPLGQPLPTGQPPSSFRSMPSEGHQCNPSISTSRTSSSSGSFTPSHFSAYSTASTDPLSSFNPSPRSSFCSTSSSSRSSIHSTSSTTSSNASCCLTVDKPIKPAAWPASDLALTKESGEGDRKEIVRDEEILGVETSDDGWVVRVWLPGFSYVPPLSVPPLVRLSSARRVPSGTGAHLFANLSSDVQPRLHHPRHQEPSNPPHHCRPLGGRQRSPYRAQSSFRRRR
jgi:hypothetical protein